MLSVSGAPAKSAYPFFPVQVIPTARPKRRFPTVKLPRRLSLPKGLGLRAQRSPEPDHRYIPLSVFSPGSSNANTIPTLNAIGPTNTHIPILEYNGPSGGGGGGGGGDGDPGGNDGWGGEGGGGRGGYSDGMCCDDRWCCDGRWCCSACFLFNRVCGRKCCLLQWFCKIMMFILMAILIVEFVLSLNWLVQRPQEVEFFATSAALSGFDVVTGGRGTSLLSYSLAVNFTAWNPNRRVAVYYDEIEASALLVGQRLSTTRVNAFYQGPKNVTSFGPVLFKGRNQAMVALDSDLTKSEFELQNSNGVFDIVVKFRMRVRFRVGLFKTWTYKPKVRCDLKVPLSNAAISSKKFGETRCYYALI